MGRIGNPSYLSSVFELNVAEVSRFARFHRGLLERGHYLPASQYEAWFLSTAHREAQIDATIAAAAAVMSTLAD